MQSGVRPELCKFYTCSGIIMSPINYRKKYQKNYNVPTKFVETSINYNSPLSSLPSPDALLRRTVSIIWITPLLIRASGRTIFALKPLDSTKVPEELETNCRGSPAAVVVLVGVVEPSRVGRCEVGRRVGRR
jgi:hypothetical protein